MVVVSRPLTTVINAGTPGTADNGVRAVSKVFNAVNKVVSKDGVIIAFTVPVRAVTNGVSVVNNPLAAV